MPEISVIVPVYNAQMYLERCIKSILGQSFTDFELILVDDGSKDSSPLLCDEAAKKDSRVRVIHKKNGGVSSARNCAIDASKGKYLIFCDSDDYVEPDWLELMHQAITKDGVEIGVCGFKFIFS
ncbi:MAG: glycosyltransferase family 2 protein, partial [Acutalibacteraceae bacterium]